MKECRNKDCNNKVNLDEIRRKYGEHSSVYIGYYCSPQCYTKDVTFVPKSEKQQLHMDENPYLYKCEIR